MLTVLFLVAYGIMTLLIVEQGNTIESQRLLIKQLFNDSTQLSAMKGREAQRQEPGRGSRPNGRRRSLSCRRPGRKSLDRGT